ncbi:hypothetical protein PALB_11260 [Pseudoalteromonas luteoviolacea B = ATCC 29581]|nr:hypothetical protein PALB_11260 [Pseudoalteromonas luteoviolacea B = ATCC 29581]
MELNSFKSFFSNAYMPHGHCYLWQEHILWTNVISDLVIAASYFSIPVAILLFANRRKDIGYHWLLWLFSAFILLCGLTHLMGIYTVWHGTYGVQGLFKAATAAVSMTTALYLYKLLPDAIKLPTLNQFEGMQSQLKKATKESAVLKSQLAEHQVTQFMLNAHPLGTVLVNQHLDIVACNPAILRELAFSSKDELLTRNLADFIMIDDPNISFESLRGTLKSDLPVTQHVLCQVKQAHGLWLPMTMSLVRESLHGQEVILLAFSNLTQQRKAESKLIEYHDRMERAINATEDGIWEWNVQSNHVDYSPTLMGLIGKAHITAPSFEDWFSHIHPDHRHKVMSAINTHFANKQKYQVEYLGLNKDGEYGWFSAVGNSQFDATGTPLIMSGSLRYIEKNKQLEQQFQEKSDILNAIFDGSSQAIWLLKVLPKNDFMFIEYNQTAALRSGLAIEDILNRPLSELSGSVIPNSIARHIQANYQRCVEAKEPIEYSESLPYLDEMRWYQTTLYPLFENNKVTKIVGAAIDITTRVQTEALLHENQNFLEKMLNSAVCGLYLFNLQKRKTTRINQRFSDLLGYELSALQRLEEQKDCYHPDDIPIMTEHWQKVRSCKEGELLPVKYRFRHAAGHWIWCYCVNTVLSFREDNVPEVILGTFVDITEQTNLLIQLQESNGYLEQFAFVASHDLQEPLRKITAFSDSLRNRLKNQTQTDEKVQFELSRLIDSASRMRIMIQDLLKLSRVHSTELNRRTTTLKQLLNDTKEQLSYVLSESKATINTRGEDLELSVDHSLFIQILQNLIANSIKFKTVDVMPIISIEVVELPRYIEIIYHDNGIGIAPQYFEQIFEPFRRLNAPQAYPGSGMGLAICKQIIKQHKGSIVCVTPSNDEGAEFKITIPKVSL